MRAVSWVLRALPRLILGSPVSGRYLPGLQGGRSARVSSGSLVDCKTQPGGHGFHTGVREPPWAATCAATRQGSEGCGGRDLWARVVGSLGAAQERACGQAGEAGPILLSPEAARRLRRAQ